MPSARPAAASSATTACARRAACRRSSTCATWPRTPPTPPCSAGRAAFFALMEAALPTEVDPATLATLGATDLGAFAATATAHPHYVPARRATYAFGIGYTTGGRVRLVELPDAGPARVMTTLALPYRTMIHDFAVTERHAIVFVAPVVFDVFGVLMGRRSVAEALDWEPARGTTVLIVDLDDPRRVRRLETDPFWAWHVVNAFEDGADLVIDLVRYADFAAQRLARRRDARRAPPHRARALHAPPHRRARARHGRGPWDRPCDFPRIPPGAEARPHDAAFVAAMVAGAAAGTDLQRSIARLEPATGRVSEHPRGRRLPVGAYSPSASTC
ncbi:MAG: carotenoid oxygenase family protein [Myxococcota bacterium]